MAKQPIGLGTAPNDGTGDTLRVAFDKTNDNFDEIYTALGDGSELTHGTHTGDVTGATALTIANNAVTNAKAADMATARIKGRVTAGTGDPEDLTAAQVATLIEGELSVAADQVTVADSGGDYTGTDVEAVLGEIAGTTDGLDSRLAIVEGAYITSSTAPVQYFDASGSGSAARPEVSTNIVIIWYNAGSTRPTNMGPNDIWLGASDTFSIAVSDEETALTTGTAKRTFRMPAAFTLTGIRASVNTAPTGATIIVDVNEGGTTILSTKLSIDATEKTSTTAATAPVISDAALADDAEITIDIDQVGSTIAGAGLKVTFIGYWTS